jgi:ribosomal protein S18 acetylase RimI-like enzyme
MSVSSNTNEFIIREYKNGDFQGIMHLWEATGMGKANRGDDETIIEDSIKLGGSLLVMEHKTEKTVCGTSWMTFDGRRIHLHHFGILPKFQGIGLSKTLLNESLAFVKRKGYQVKLEVHKENKIALNLYTNAGFDYLGDYNVYIIRDVSKI